jgi:hypothetical protein
VPRSLCYVPQSARHSGQDDRLNQYQNQKERKLRGVRS